MICPKCKGEMRVVRTIQVGDDAQTRHLECPNMKCGTTGTAVSFVVNHDPGYGKGAAKLAEEIKNGRVKMPKIKKFS